MAGMRDPGVSKGISCRPARDGDAVSAPQVCVLIVSTPNYVFLWIVCRHRYPSMQGPRFSTSIPLPMTFTTPSTYSFCLFIPSPDLVSNHNPSNSPARSVAVYSLYIQFFFLSLLTWVRSLCPSCAGARRLSRRVCWYSSSIINY